MYNVISEQLATNGFVVCSIEHNDGTAPKNYITLDSKYAIQSIEAFKLRNKQVNQRLKEVETVLNKIQSSKLLTKEN